MHSDLHIHLAQATARERGGRDPLASTLALRRAGTDDADVVHRLAALDGVRPLDGDVLLALSDGAPVAAMSLADGRVAADPFARTADAVELLQVRRGSRRRRRFPRLRPRLAG